ACAYHAPFSLAPALTEFYPLSLHDALPIFSVLPCIDVVAVSPDIRHVLQEQQGQDIILVDTRGDGAAEGSAGAPYRGVDLVLVRSEEHTSELQSRENLVCRLLLEKKKRKPH